MTRGTAFRLSLVVFALQFVLVGVTTPLTALFGDRSFFYYDHPYHLYQVELGRALLEHGRLVGYDPFFAGGYAGGVTFNASGRLPFFAASLLPATVSTATVYGFYVFFCALLAPLGVVIASWQLRWTLWQAASAALLALLYWWIGPLRTYHTAGMVSYVFVCYCAVGLAAWLWRLCTAPSIDERAPSMRSIVSAGVVGGIGLWTHPLFALIVAILFLGMAVTKRPSTGVKSWLTVLVPVAAIALVINLPWVIASVGADMLALQQPYQRETGVDVVAGPLLQLSGNRMASLLHPFGLVACVIGLAVIRGDARREVMAVMVAASTFMLFGSLAGSIDLLAVLQPTRFVEMGFLTLVVGAGFVVGTFGERLVRSNSVTRKGAACAVTVLLLSLPLRELQREISTADIGHHGKVPPEMTGVPPGLRWLDDWIRTNTTVDGRILFESSLARVHEGGHIEGHLALASGREFIGGPYPYIFPDVSFWDRAGFGEELGRLSVERFRNGIEIENVGWIVAHSSELMAFLKSVPGVRLVASHGPLNVYAVDRRLSFVQSGTGRVTARRFDRVDVADASGPSIVLRYRWVPGLHAFPPARIEPADGDDGFPRLIRVINPPANFTLSMNGRSPP